MDVAASRDVAFDSVVRQLARADIVFFGEQHDDPETHRVEFGLLDAIGRAGRPVILSLEMFERDVQSVLDDYLAGRIAEADLLAGVRRTVADLIGIEARYLDRDGIHARYAELVAARENRKAA